MEKPNYVLLLKVAIGFVVVMTLILSMNYDKKSDNATYRITSGNDRTYYTQTFRSAGRFVVFDDVYGKKVILTGDIDIEKLKNNDL